MGRNPAVSGRGTSEAPAPERVLWVVNSVPHEASVLFGETPQPFGGWVEAAAEGLRSLGVRPLIAHPAPRSHAPADGASARHVAYPTLKPRQPIRTAPLRCAAPR